MPMTASAPLAEPAPAPSKTSIGRQQVARAFDRGAARYLDLAQAQHVMAKDLFESLPRQLPVSSRVLDLGCGPGHWTLKLARHYPHSLCMGLDLSMAMLTQAAHQHAMEPTDPHQGLHWLRGDAERLPLADASLDLVFSSLAVQWCESPRHWLAELARTLRPGGRAFINTLGPGTLQEVRHAWQRRDNSIRHFPSADTLASQARAVGLSCHWQMRRHVFHYPDFAAVMQSIKGIGAQTANGQRLTRAQLQQARHRHTELSTDKGLPVSYHVIELRLYKPVYLPQYKLK